MKRARRHAIPAAWRRSAALFVALGDAQRQRILLMFRPGERLRVGDIVAGLTLSRTAVAHHLRIMRDAGVLAREKVGKEVWYSPDVAHVRARLVAVLAELDRHG